MLKIFRSFLVYTLLLALPFLVNGQINISEYGRYDSIGVSHFGDTLDHPWIGGLNNPSFSSVDINQDLYADLFVFDKDHGSVRIFLNLEDSLGNRYWQAAPEYQSNFPNMWVWAHMVDYNNDGKADIFTAAGNGDIRLFQNVSTGGEPQDVAFKQILFKSPIDSNQRVDYMTCRFRLNPGFIYTNVFNLASDFPAFFDVDYDGDLDVLAFGSTSAGVYLYENKCRDIYGHSDSMLLDLEDICWGEFLENPGQFNLVLDTCRGKIPMAPNGGHGGASRHEGSNLVVEDFDCNGLPDILLGDISFPKMVMGYNGGTKQNAKMTSQDTLWPNYDTPVDVFNHPAAHLVDIDFDGLKEVVVAPNATAFFEDFNQIWVYKNSGTPACPDLSYQTNDFIVGESIDMGTNAFPLLIDVNGDSLEDILLGSFGVWTQSYSHESRIAYYKNVGSKTNPVYSLITRDYLLLPLSQDSGLYPTKGDLDGDGDMDLLLGTDRGRLLYYENQAASPGDSLELVLKTTSFSGMDFGKSLRPFLFDVDNDNKLDLLMGSQLSSVSLFKNIGTTAVPQFDTNTVVNNWGNIEHFNGLGFGNLSVVVKDLDTAGSYLDSLTNVGTQRQVFVGSSMGWVYRYEGMDSTGGNSLTLKDSLFMFSTNASLSMEDITGDGKPDMLVGQISGGVSVLLKDGGNIIVPPPVDSCIKDPNTGFCVGVAENILDQSIKIFPNPTRGLLHIELQSEELDPHFGFELRDMSNRLILDGETKQSTSLDIGDLPAGIYWLGISTQHARVFRKVVKSGN